MFRYHKDIRLAPANYLGYAACFVTICSFGRAPLFANHALARRILDLLREEAAHHAFDVRAYCFMPDHLHILAQGSSPDSNLLRFVKVFKHRSSFFFKQSTGSSLWQTSFYDHILRRADSLDSVAWYIWSNPVRAGLCSSPHDYPLLGSFTSDWQDATPPPHPWTPPWNL